MTADVGLPVSAAIVAFGEGRHSDVIERLHPIRAMSTASAAAMPSVTLQRTLLEAALVRGQHDLAAPYSRSAFVIKEASLYNWAKLAQLRSAEGDGSGRVPRAGSTRCVRLPDTAPGTSTATGERAHDRLR